MLEPILAPEMDLIVLQTSKLSSWRPAIPVLLATGNDWILTGAGRAPCGEDEGSLSHHRECVAIPGRLVAKCRADGAITTSGTTGPTSSQLVVPWLVGLIRPQACVGLMCALSSARARSYEYLQW